MDFSHITLGRVVDTNDPQQMGRLKVMCPALNDTPTKTLRNLPWATYVAPFAGITERGSRGRDSDVTVGPIAYGMWNIPKVGATVLVACIDGDASIRVWLGCIHNQLLTHTMPHGRFSYRDEMVTSAGFGWSGEEGKPIGPFSSQEEKIEPTFTQLELAFTPSMDTVGAKTTKLKPQVNFEWRSRGADHTVSGLSEKVVSSDSQVTSFVRDDADIGDSSGKLDGFTEPDGNNLKPDQVEQGYNKSRIIPGLKFETTVKNYDSEKYSWVTPGFHAISMDDSSTNCRMRFRTTHGHQIILDDTNERIYISTAGGKSWAEMDEKGNIDYYASRNISFHAEKDFNVTADTIRMTAKHGIHLESDTEMRIHAKEHLHIKTNGSLYLDSATVNITADTQMDIKVSNGTLHIGTSADINMLAGGNSALQAKDISNVASGQFFATASANNNIYAGGEVLLTGSTVHANGPSAGQGINAVPAVAANPKESFLTDRIPEHEPWPRIMTKITKTDQSTGNAHLNSAEYPYDSPHVGRIERGFDLSRNKNWHR